MNKNSLSKISISRFNESDDESIIISTINNMIYIFDKEGEILYETNDTIMQLNGDYYSLVPINKTDSEYEYMIGFINDSKEICLFFFKYDNNTKKNNITYKMEPFKPRINEKEYIIEEKGLSCQLMTNSFQSNVIVCFICINTDWGLMQVFIDPNSHTKINSNDSKLINHTDKNSYCKYIKSSITLDKKKTLICLSYHNQKSYCITYSIQNNSFSNFIYYNVDCSPNHAYDLNVDYIRETEQFLFYCSVHGNILIAAFDKNVEIINTYQSKISQYDIVVYGISVLYLSQLKKYYNILDYNSTQNNFIEFNSTINSLFIDNNNFRDNATTYLTTTTVKGTTITDVIATTLTDTATTDITKTIVTDNATTYPTTTTVKDTTITDVITTTLTDTTTTDITTTIVRDNTATDVTTTTVTSIILIQEIYEDKIYVNKDNLKEEIPSIIKKIEIGKIYKKVGEDYSILIYPTNSTYLTSTTHVDFNECEKKIRKHFNISDSNIITFLQIELENEDSKSLINQVEYQAYDQNINLLDLSICNDVNIQVFYAIKNNSSIDLDSVNSFKESGIDIFNINDSFFNDICHPYSESDNDVILEDRIKYIYQNYSLCEEGCTYNEIDLENMTISCNCSVKDNISTVVSSLNFEEVEGSSTNFDVIKCYNLVFSLSGKLNNIGFWIFSILILAHFPPLIFYFFKGIKPVKDYILKEMKKYGYIKDDNKMKNDDNTTNKKVKKNKKIKRKIKIKRKRENTSIKKNTNSAIASPPKNINKKTNKNLHSKNGKSFTIKNLKIINNSSSLNILKKCNKGIITNINKATKNNENSTNDKENKFMDNLSRNKSNKIFNNSTRPNRYKTTKFTHLQTQAPKIENEGNESQEKNAKKKNLNNFALINIDLNLSRDKKHIPPESYIILNNYTFKEAREYDMRQLCVIFYIFALSKQIFFHTFLYRSPLELFPLRLCLFIFMFSCDLALNALFYFNNNISKKYRNAKNVFLFAFSDNITIIILSIFVGFILLTSLAKLSNSTNKIREIFNNEEEKLKKDKKYKVTEKRKQEILFEIEELLRKYKIKIIILIIIELILVVFFWYFVTAFCHVYQETQISWLLDSLISILIRAIIELLISLGLAKLYRISIDAEIYCLYRFVMFLYNFG